MATIEKLIERIERRLFMAAGISVQTHAEEQLVEMLRGVYDTLFDDFWYPEYTFHMTKTLVVNTGEVSDDISDLVLRYKDIHSVHWDEDEDPLPRVTAGSPLSRIRRRCIMPSPDPTKVFRVYPLDESGQVHIWYRTKLSDDVWEDQEYNTNIPFDDSVLLYGVVYEYLLMDDSNSNATQEYKAKFMGRQDQMRKAQWEHGLSKKKLDRDGPATRWE